MSDAEETLYRIFAGLSGGTVGSVSGGAIASTIEAATIGGPGSKATGSGSGGSTAETIAMDVLKTGFGMVPLVTALFGLFGGGGQEAPPPLVKYAPPESVAFEAADTGAGLASVDYDQAGRPRAYGAELGAGAAAPAPAPQVQVTVNAMDARSFLDRSGDIAAAVREAMLNLNSINDVVNDL